MNKYEKELLIQIKEIEMELDWAVNALYDILNKSDTSNGERTISIRDVADSLDRLSGECMAVNMPYTEDSGQFKASFYNKEITKENK